MGKNELISSVLTNRLNLQITGLALVLLLALTNTIAAHLNFTSTLLSWIFHILVTLLLYTCIRAPLIVLLLLGAGNSIVFEVLRHVNVEVTTRKGISIQSKVQIRDSQNF